MRLFRERLTFFYKFIFFNYYQLIELIEFYTHPVFIIFSPLQRRFADTLVNPAKITIFEIMAT